MNTKTMRLPPRRVLTSRKRKDRDEGFDTPKPSPPAPPAPPPPPPPKIKSPKPTTTLQHRLGSRNQQSEPVPSNQLLAGYLAHEYLTKGTLFGQPWDPARAESVSPSTLESKPSQKAKEAEPNNSHDKTDQNQNYQRYVEVSNLLKAKGTHLPGVVNPSQLAHLLQM